MTRAGRGQVAYHAGLAAEEAVARHYDRTGRAVAARRWRSAAGEVDLIARDGEEVVFVEVKRAATHAAAAERLCRRQMDRLCQAAAMFLEGEPLGSLTPMRFDLALVDGAGRIEVLENAFAA
jgi:putative endonuclease